MPKHHENHTSPYIFNYDQVAGEDPNGPNGPGASQALFPPPTPTKTQTKTKKTSRPTPTPTARLKIAYGHVDTDAINEPSKR